MFYTRLHLTLVYYVLLVCIAVFGDRDMGTIILGQVAH